MKNCTLICFLFILASCINPTNNEIGEDQFFSLKDYFKKELESLSGKVKGTKKVVYNDKTETINLNNYDPSKDLRSFVNSDINNPSWIDKYKADTTTHGNQKIITYTGFSEKLKTKKIDVFKIDNKVSKIVILNADTSILKSYREKLSYEPSKGYEIDILQKTAQGQANSSNILVTYQ